jgi:hypothetical protein
LKIIALFNDFTVQHAFRDENIVVNDLVQQHQVSDQIKESCMFWKNWMFRFPEPDGLVLS